MKRIDFKSVSELVAMVDAAAIAVNHHHARLRDYDVEDGHQLYLLRQVKAASIHEHLLRAEVNFALYARDKKLSVIYRSSVHAADAKVHKAQAEAAMARAEQAQREYDEVDAKWVAS